MAGKIKLLLVDDEEKNIKILLEILEYEEDYRIKTALSGKECLALLPEFKPDVVLLDIIMPDVDGYAICRQIRQDPDLHAIKVLMLSGRAMKDEIEKGMAAGADMYLSKPFSMSELLDALKVLRQEAAST